MITRKKKKINKNKKKFRLRAKTMFLTYPQLPKEITKQNIVDSALEHYETVFKSPFDYLIVIELHEDGNPHLHVLLKFPKVQNIYSANKLDIQLIEPGQEGVEDVSYTCHGKYEASKSEHKVIQYLLKDVDNKDDLFTNMNLPMIDDVYYSNPYEHLYAIMLKCGYAAAIQELYHRYPKEATLKGNSIAANLMQAAHFIRGEERLKNRVEYDLSDFVELPKPIKEWLAQKDQKPLILYGGSGFGKTALAKSLMKYLNKNYMIVSDINDLRRFDSSSFDAIIFDDLDFTDMSRESIIHLIDVEEDRSIRVLYGTASIPALTSKIFTLNYIQSLLRNNDEAIARRLKTCEISKPIYKLSQKEALELIERNTIIHPALSTSTPGSGTSLGDNAIGKDVDCESANNKMNTNIIDAESTIKKRKRGRPKGSKNKPKEVPKLTKK